MKFRMRCLKADGESSNQKPVGEMQLGTSRLGVIAVVSLLVTAAPERNEGGGGNNRDSRIDHSSGATEKVRISRGHYTWRSQVATLSSVLNEPVEGLVKKDLVKRGDTTRHEASNSRSTSLIHKNDRNIETSTTISGFTIKLSGSTRALNEPRNFDGPAQPLSDWSTSSTSYVKIIQNNVKKISSLGNVPSTRNSEEKFVVTLDSPISDIITDTSSYEPRPRRSHRRRRCRRRRRRQRQRRSPPRPDKRETISQDGRRKIYDEYDDKIETTSLNEATKMRNVRSSNVESAITKGHSTMTMPSTSKTNKTFISGQRNLNVNYQNFSVDHESRTVRNYPEFTSDNASLNEAHFDNDEPRNNQILRPSTETIILESMNLRNSPHPTNDPSTNEPNYHFPSQKQVDTLEIRNDRETKEFGDYTRSNETLNSLIDEHLPKDEAKSNLVRASETMKDNGTTSRSLVLVTAIKDETIEQSRVTVEVGQAREISLNSLKEVPSLLRLTGNVVNTSGVDAVESLDNHKGSQARSFQTASLERQKQEVSSLNQSLSLSSGMPEQFGIKDVHLAQDSRVSDDRNDRITINANQILFPKSSYTIMKNNTKQSINLVDGKANKIFYEIKPSLITDMDRGDDIEATTMTTKRTFEKFLLPSVPSAFGKFGPYFLDEEDRRNVTERIGSTVQLNCRIGLLGHRKVTWLQHYKDSFRLLTVERESYSVDRRISLNFQYPDNWRLQIAYASMRDSGLYKCQVEIDQDRSLVKRYNVIITAPILTITDDSGRPVSGERHLKAGSALKLRCEARDVIQRLNESVLWMRGDETLTDDVSENRTTEIVNENEVTVVISTLFVERAIPRHAGNYSCVVPDKARTTIAVHVLNGELPAAVQHGSGVSTAVLNLWLIHLTASYGFFR